MTEQGVLRISIGVTLLLALLGIVFGLLSGSYAIVFDGVYALTDASMTVLALVVARLIATSTAPGAPAKGFIAHFTMGFWHLEPMVLGLNGILLMSASVYALINAVGSLMSGGRALDFDQAILYAVITVAVALSIALVVRRANQAIRSDFLALDAKAWMMWPGSPSRCWWPSSSASRWRARRARGSRLISIRWRWRWSASSSSPCRSPR